MRLLFGLLDLLQLMILSQTREEMGLGGRAQIERIKGQPMAQSLRGALTMISSRQMRQAFTLRRHQW